VREVDGVLHDVDLVLQRRRDVDRRVGDDQRPRVGRHVHDEAWLMRRFGAQPGLAATTAPSARRCAGCPSSAPRPCPRAPARPPSRPFEFVAQTQSSQSVNIQARVSGFLDKRVYTEGDVVRAGQVLFLMDPKPLQAQVDASQAALNNAQAALDVAKFNLDRIKPLAAQNALSQKDLDDANGQYLSSRANVDQARAQLESAKLNLSYATITSPITGVTGSAIVADGTYVSTSNSQLTTVAVLSPMWVTFSLSEAEALRYREEIERGTLRRPPNGQYTVEVVMADGSVFPETGRITFFDPAYNSQTGTFTVRVQLANPQGLLRPNQFVRARLKGAVRPNAQSVPLRAVQQGPKGHFVWVVGPDSTVQMRPVAVGQWQGDDWLISSGLEPNAVVVVDGALTLTPGAAVKPRPLELPKGSVAGASAAGPAASVPAAPPAGVLPARVYFASGSATLDANAQETLRTVGHGVVGSRYAIVITGYADAAGAGARNRTLAEQRAKAVRDALLATGIASERLRLAPPGDVIGGADPKLARRVEIAFADR
jgi:membrane fusion protein (multidrug efflux system)